MFHLLLLDLICFHVSALKFEIKLRVREYPSREACVAVNLPVKDQSSSFLGGIFSQFFPPEYYNETGSSYVRTYDIWYHRQCIWIKFWLDVWRKGCVIISSSFFSLQDPNPFFVLFSSRQNYPFVGLVKIKNVMNYFHRQYAKICSVPVWFEHDGATLRFYVWYILCSFKHTQSHHEHITNQLLPWSMSIIFTMCSFLPHLCWFIQIQQLGMCADIDSFLGNCSRS